MTSSKQQSAIFLASARKAWRAHYYLGQEGEYVFYKGRLRKAPILVSDTSDELATKKKQLYSPKAIVVSIADGAEPGDFVPYGDSYALVLDKKDGFYELLIYRKWVLEVEMVKDCPTHFVLPDWAKASLIDDLLREARYLRMRDEQEGERMLQILENPISALAEKGWFVHVGKPIPPWSWYPVKEAWKLEGNATFVVAKQRGEYFELYTAKFVGYRICKISPVLVAYRVVLAGLLHAEISASKFPISPNWFLPVDDPPSRYESEVQVCMKQNEPKFFRVGDEFFRWVIVTPQMEFVSGDRFEPNLSQSTTSVGLPPLEPSSAKKVPSFMSWLSI